MPKVISKDEIKEIMDQAFEDLAINDWDPSVKIVDLPKNFTDEAMKEVFKQAGLYIVDLLEAATGVAYIRNKECVSAEDIQTANLVLDNDPETVLPKPNDNW